MTEKQIPLTLFIRRLVGVCAVCVTWRGDGGDYSQEAGDRRQTAAGSTFSLLSYPHNFTSNPLWTRTSHGYRPTIPPFTVGRAYHNVWCVFVGSVRAYGTGNPVHLPNSNPYLVLLFFVPTAESNLGTRLSLILPIQISLVPRSSITANVVVIEALGRRLYGSQC